MNALTKEIEMSEIKTLLIFFVLQNFCPAAVLRPLYPREVSLSFLYIFFMKILYFFYLFFMSDKV